MPKISRLSKLDTLVGGDLLAVHDSSSTTDMKASLTQLVSYLTSSLSSVFEPQFVNQEYALTANNTTIQVTDGSDSVWLIIKPDADGYTGMVVKMPALGNCVDGQTVLIHCKGGDTAADWTVNGNGATVFGGPDGATAFTEGERYELRFSSADNTWYGQTAV